MPRKIIPFPGRVDSIPPELIKKAVSAALEEDLGTVSPGSAGDITSLYTLSGPGNLPGKPGKNRQGGSNSERGGHCLRDRYFRLRLQGSRSRTLFQN